MSSAGRTPRRFAGKPLPRRGLRGSLAEIFTDYAAFRVFRQNAALNVSMTVVLFQFDAVILRVKVQFHLFLLQFSIFSEIHTIAMRAAKPRACASSHHFHPHRQKMKISKKIKAIIIPPIQRRSSM